MSDDEIKAGDYVIIDGDDAVARRVNTIVYSVAAPWHDYEREAGVPPRVAHVESGELWKFEVQMRSNPEFHATEVREP